MENENKVSSISKARSYEEMGEFWSTHSTTDYEDQTYEVDITFSPTALPNLVPIEPELMQDLRTIAQERRISAETLINVWLRHYVDQLQMHPALAIQE